VLIVKIVGIALVAVVLLAVVRERQPAMGVQLSIAASVMLLWLVVGQIRPILELFQRLSGRAQLNLHYVNTLLKIIAIAYLAEFGAQLCKDAEEGALASKVELAGKVMILLLSIPIIVAVVELLLRLLPEV
jgi:stage III sporulation protein AD